VLIEWRIIWVFFKCASASWFLEEWSEQAAKLFFQNMLQGVSIRFKLRVLGRNASKLPSGNYLVLACQFVCDTMSDRRFAGDATPLKYNLRSCIDMLLSVQTLKPKL
jgi:hypothetical protein